MSKIFKSSRVVLDDKAFVLTAAAPVLPPIPSATDGEDAHEPANEKALYEARSEADAILAQADFEVQEKMRMAQKSSESIISDAYDKAKEIMEASRAQGYKEGLEQGLSEGQLEADRQLEDANAVKSEWLMARSNIYEDIEKEMVHLVIETVERILNHRIEQDIHLIESLIRLGVERINQTEKLTIRVSTEDYNQAVGVKPMIQTMCDKIDEIEIKRDPMLSNGSCIIDGDSGSIDSSVWTQFEQVKKLFEGMLKGDVDGN